MLKIIVQSNNMYTTFLDCCDNYSILYIRQYSSVFDMCVVFSCTSRCASPFLLQILKASEPIITVTLSFLLHNKVHPPSTYIAVVLITVGICLCSATDITFNYVGTAITLASSICLPLRNIYGKQVNTAVGGSMNMFIIATWVASAAWLPIYLMLRLGIYSNVPFSLSSNNGQDVNMDVWVAAACHVSIFFKFCI